MRKSNVLKKITSHPNQQLVTKVGLAAPRLSISLIPLLCSFIVSVLFIWLVGYFFCDSLRPFKYDVELGKFIHTPHTLYKQRSEGFAKTYKGLFGINSIPDISKVEGDKIVVWGDSYVEARFITILLDIPVWLSE